MSINIPHGQSPLYLQSMHMPQAGMQSVYRNNIAGSSNNFLLISNVPTNHQLNSVATDHLQSNTNNENAFKPYAQFFNNIKLKKIPFYENVSDILKPSYLIGQDTCSLPVVPRGAREAIHCFILPVEVANYLSLHRNINTNEYLYQVQIRICLFQSTSTEITDCLPLGLHIRINNKNCELPSITGSTRSGNDDRLIASPINCTGLIKLSPSVVNTVIVNWIPDANTYVIGVHLVKQLSSEILLQKLYDREAKSSEETKDDIIKSLADVDPDLTTTSYIFSLVCPLGKKRTKIPVKSTKCKHIQCFDARTFIEMNEIKATWTCPTCSKPCMYDDLQIQSYFLQVLSNSSILGSCEEIELLADGTWIVYDENKYSIDLTADSKRNLTDTINLDDSDDENCIIKKEPKPEISDDKSINLTDLIDLTLLSDDEEEQSNEKEENEARSADFVYSVTEVNLISQARVQSQQAVTSTEQGEIIKIDCSISPTASPIHSTSVS